MTSIRNRVSRMILRRSEFERTVFESTSRPSAPTILDQAYPESVGRLYLRMILQQSKVERTLSESTSMPSAPTVLNQADTEFVGRFMQLPNELKWNILRRVLRENHIIRITCVPRQRRPPLLKNDQAAHDFRIDAPLLERILHEDADARQEFFDTYPLRPQFADRLSSPIRFDSKFHTLYFESYDAFCQFERPGHYNKNSPRSHTLSGTGIRTIIVRLSPGCGKPEGCRDDNFVYCGSRMRLIRSISFDFIRHVKTLERIILILDEDMTNENVQDCDTPTLITPEHIKVLAEIRKYEETWPGRDNLHDPVSVFVTNVMTMYNQSKDILDAMEARTGKMPPVVWNMPDMYFMTQQQFDGWYDWRSIGKPLKANV